MTESQVRAKVVATAEAWLGYNETNGKFKQILDLYNSHKPLARGYAMKYTDEWCACTVSAVSIKLGYTDIMPTEVGCGKMIALYQQLGRWQENDAYKPSAGDVIFYDWSDSGSGDCTASPDHVGIVASVTGNSIKVIEGNKGEAVAYRNITVNGRYIRGYGVPDYASKATEANTSSTTTTTTTGGTFEMTMNYLRKGSTGNSVKALQILLNAYGYNCGEVDGDFGPKTLAAVNAYQKAKVPPADGIVGKNTWQSLLN